jgi:hypothetical protein
MSKRFVTWKKTLLLLSMGAAVPICLPVPGLPSIPTIGGCQYLCNSDLAGFYQTVGDASIDAAFDPARNVYGANSDFTTIVVEPTVDVIQTIWDQWICASFPRDPVPACCCGDFCP